MPFDEVTDLQRRNAKAVNFGIVYGISSFGLSQDLSITRKEAAEYIERYFETYPKIKGFLDGLVEEGKEKGYVTTMFGRRRPIPELKSGNFMQRSFGERVAMNSPIQGTAADIIKIAMNRVYRRLKDENLKSRLVLQVHDELLIETCKEEIPQVSAILEEEMKAVGNVYITTDDGSYERKGMVTQVIQELHDQGKQYDVCVAIGPMIMMKFVCKLTKELGIPTVVSMNPIMVDGTGMCGACRLIVGGEVKFACVDGPEFDGHQVDFDQAMKRQAQYKTEEGRAMLKLQEGDTHHGGCGQCN